MDTDSRQAGAQIEISRKMIEAASDVLEMECDISPLSCDRLAERMLRAALEQVDS